jgi:hypothetical protein
MIRELISVRIKNDSVSLNAIALKIYIQNRHSTYRHLNSIKKKTANCDFTNKNYG